MNPQRTSFVMPLHPFHSVHLWIRASIRSVLRRGLSPHAYRRIVRGRNLCRWYASVCRWYASVYLPQLFISFFVRRTPDVQGVPSVRSSVLVRQLRNINVLAPTKMCRVMTECGSDKGSHRWHNYTTIYSMLLSGLRKEPLRIFELGIGTSNPAMPFNMGPNCRPGASLRGWRNLFPNAFVYGADIDRDVLFQEERIKTFYCDQCDNVTIQKLWGRVGLGDPMDVIIDDGLHTLEGNSSFLEASLGRVRPGGLYVIEDLPRETVDIWKTRLEEVYSGRFPDYDFAVVELPLEANSYDNNLLVIRRRK